MTRQAEKTVAVFWRLPARLVADCEEADPNGSWPDGFREFLRAAAEDRHRLVVDGPSVSTAISLPESVERYLEREAARLTKATGQSWSAMKVARELWRQLRLPVLSGLAEG